MTFSMTAFARRDRETPWGSLVWELRSVNHRYLEVVSRLPDELRSLEPQVRQLVGQQLARGKVDCTLRFQPKDLSTGEFELNQVVVQRIVDASAKIQAFAPESASLRAIDILRWPGVLKTVELDADALGREAMELLSQALRELVDTRGREGERLRQIVMQRLQATQQVLSSVRGALTDVRQQFRQRLQDRLAELKQEVDPIRLEQEIALLAQKTDVQEEFDRLQTHVNEVQRVLDETGPIGRRLDFLMQELNREANTLAAKSTDLQLTNAAIELKVLIEQMREQVQNVE
ncbi:MAG: YicC/YloC family endoribonuclease [Acidiferrobacterales bacterium]|nr:YicC/YloC family endoribonuclease [Acidiferrobacterales bacterium]